jgi:hypothetical protein
VPEELLSAVDDKSAAIIFTGWLDDLHLVKYAKSRKVKGKQYPKEPLSGRLGKS